jgi:type II secretory ATPase GspE/PulE/Tfp pilus assembly ATPase PilB-like protein
LCENCREPYPPPANVLQQMGIPPGKVQVLYRPPQQREDVCPECGGVGYKGRIALFELMVVDDNVRGVIARGGDRNAILQAARAAGMRGLQEEGVMLVVRGATSLPELIRVLKQ